MPPEWHPCFLLTTIGILLEAIFLFVTYYEFCLESLIWYESLLVLLCFEVLDHCWTHPFERAKNYAMLSPMFHLNFKSHGFALVLHLYLFEHDVLQYFVKKFSLASLKLIWEKEILCSWSSLIFVWAYRKQHMKLVPKW